MLDKAHLQTVAEALHLMHESFKSTDIDPVDAEEGQTRVYQAWHALALPGEPWEF
jgi:hypothetical protein